MLTEKDYCDYETQKSLMNIGFPMKAQSYDLGKGVKEHLPKIHLYEAQKWLREEKNTIIVVCPYTYNMVDETHTWTCELWFGDNLEIGIHDFNFYEEALSEGIKEAVKILKEK